jgi:hypothetical protein
MALDMQCNVAWSEVLIGSDYAVRAASVVNVVDTGSYVHGVDAAWCEVTFSLRYIPVQNNHNMRSLSYTF